MVFDGGIVVEVLDKIKVYTSASNATEGSTNDPEYGYVNTLSSDGFGVRAGANDGNGRWTTDRGEGGGDKYVAFGNGKQMVVQQVLILMVI